MFIIRFSKCTVESICELAVTMETAAYQDDQHIQIILGLAFQLNYRQTNQT